MLNSDSWWLYVGMQRTEETRERTTWCVRIAASPPDQCAPLIGHRATRTSITLVDCDYRHVDETTFTHRTTLLHGMTVLRGSHARCSPARRRPSSPHCTKLSKRNRSWADHLGCVRMRHVPCRVGHCTNTVLCHNLEVIYDSSCH
jgi:hypothetical protein